MTDRKEKSLDHWFKLAVVVGISITGWFLNRIVNKFDAVETSIQELKIEMREQRTTVNDLKDDFKDLKQTGK